MKKANVTQNNAVYEDRIIITNIQELGDYFMYVREPKSKERMESALTIEGEWEKFNVDYKLESYASIIQQKTGKGAIHTIADFESRARLAMIKQVSNGVSIMANENGGWCFLSDDAIIEWLDNAPYVESDIQISQYRFGSHFYAKVRKIDVVDKDGSVKWNTEKGAKQAALRFLATLNKELRSKTSN